MSKIIIEELEKLLTRYDKTLNRLGVYTPLEAYSVGINRDDLLIDCKWIVDAVRGLLDGETIDGLIIDKLKELRIEYDDLMEEAGFSNPSDICRHSVHCTELLILLRDIIREVRQLLEEEIKK